MYRSTFYLTWALVGGEWPASRLGRCTLGERTTGNRWIGGWADPIAGLEYVEKRKFVTLLGLELHPVAIPAPRGIGIIEKILVLSSILEVFLFFFFEN
jgi:hypothetical protein